MPFGYSDIFEADPIAEVNWRNDPELKRQFGAYLARGMTPFDAGCEVFPEDTNKVVWASKFWLDDDIVVAEKANFSEKKTEVKLLDNKELACKLLEFSDERYPNGLPYHESKDRLAAFKLYAEVMGFIGKQQVHIDASTQLKQNFMQIKFVKPDVQEKTIEHTSEEIKSEDAPTLPIKLKLVS